MLLFRLKLHGMRYLELPLRGPGALPLRLELQLKLRHLHDAATHDLVEDKLTWSLLRHGEAGSLMVLADHVGDGDLEVALGDNTITIDVELCEQVIEHLLSADLLELKLLGPCEHNLIEVLPAEDLANVSFRAFLVADQISDEGFDQDRLCTRLHHLVEVERIVWLLAVRDENALDGAVVRRAAHLRLCHLDLFEQAEHAPQLHEDYLTDDRDLLELELKHGLVHLDKVFLARAHQVAHYVLSLVVRAHLAVRLL